MRYSEHTPLLFILGFVATGATFKIARDVRFATYKRKWEKIDEKKFKKYYEHPLKRFGLKFYKFYFPPAFPPIK